MELLTLFDLSPRQQALVEAGAPERLVEVVSPLVVSCADRHAVEPELYVGRDFAGRRDIGFGNPLRLEHDTPADRLELLRRFWALLRDGDARLPRSWRARIEAGELSGRVLGCWCAPRKLCHGHVLAAAAVGLHAELDLWLAPR